MDTDEPDWQENHEYANRHVRVVFRQHDAARHEHSTLGQYGGGGRFVGGVIVLAAIRAGGRACVVWGRGARSSCCTHEYPE